MEHVHGRQEPARRDLRPSAVFVAMLLTELAVDGLVSQPNLALSLASGLGTPRNNPPTIGRALRVMEREGLITRHFDPRSRQRIIEIHSPDLVADVRALIG